MMCFWRLTRLGLSGLSMQVWPPPTVDLLMPWGAWCCGQTPLNNYQPRVCQGLLSAHRAVVATRQWQSLKAVVVQAQNVGQAFQYAVTGNVSHALVAASYVHAKANYPGEWILVDRRWHGPIRQDAVRLTNAPNPAKAKAFMTYLRSPAAAQVLKAFGYDTAVPAP
jgi:molybdenum ABC transporter molybdate-binding protein